MKIGNCKLKIAFLALFLVILFGARNASASVISRPVLDLGLVGYWSFDTGIGETTVKDLTGNGSNVGLAGFTVNPVSKAWVDGKIKKAIEFDGANTDLETSGDADILDITSNLTLSAWIYPRSAGEDNFGRIVDGAQGGTGYVFRMTSSNRFQYIVGGTAISSATNAITFNKWQHVVAAYNNNDGKVYLYVNGQQVGSGSISAPVGNNLVFSIGGDSVAGGVFDGLIDDVRIYSRALSPQEVMRLYRASAAANIQTRAANKGVPKTITATKLTSALDQTDATSYTTASIHPSGNALLLLGVFNKIGAGTANIPTISGNGLNWVQIGSDTFSGAITVRMSLFRAMGPSSSAGAITISFAGQTQTDIIWAVSEFKGVDISGTDGSGAIVQAQSSKNAAVTSITMVLNAFANSRNRTAGIVGITNDFGITPGSGYSELAEEKTGDNQNIDMNMQWDSNNANTTFNASWTGGNAANNGIAVELKAGNFNTTVINSPVNQLTNGLVGYWTFDGGDLSGTTAIDRSGQGNNGTLTNGPNRVIGKLGQALSFDGSNDYVDAGSAASLDNLNPLTYTAWIKINSFPATDFAGIITKAGITNPKKACFLDNRGGTSGDKTLALNAARGSVDAKVIAADNSFVSGKWYHIACVFDLTGTYRLYINGAEPAYGTNTQGSGTNATDGAQSVFVGAFDASPTSNFFNGIIDDIRVYSRALTPAEVLRLYRLGR